MFGLHAPQTTQSCHPSNHHKQEARVLLIYESHKQIHCRRGEASVETDVIQTKAKQQNQQPWHHEASETQTEC